MKFFVSCIRNGQPCYIKYEGMNQPTIEMLLADLGASNIQFITENEYLATLPVRV